jgi:hypothetical protein
MVKRGERDLVRRSRHNIACKQGGQHDRASWDMAARSRLSKHPAFFKATLRLP